MRESSLHVPEREKDNGSGVGLNDDKGVVSDKQPISSSEVSGKHIAFHEAFSKGFSKHVEKKVSLVKNVAKVGRATAFLGTCLVCTGLKVGCCVFRMLFQGGGQ